MSKYITKGEYKNIFIISKKQFEYLPIPDEAKECINFVMDSFCGDNDMPYGQAARAFLLRSFDWAAQKACEGYGDSLEDDGLEAVYDEEKDCFVGKVDLVWVFKEWIKAEKQNGIDLEYAVATFWTGLQVGSSLAFRFGKLGLTEHHDFTELQFRDWEESRDN